MITPRGRRTLQHVRAEWHAAVIDWLHGLEEQDLVHATEVLRWLQARRARPGPQRPD